MIVNGEPVPIAVISHALVYQPTTEPIPPITLKLSTPPSSEHILFLSIVPDVGAVAPETTVTVMLTHVELVHGDAVHAAQYVIVVVGADIVRGFPVPIDANPQLNTDHSGIEPLPPETLKLIFPPALAQKLFLSDIAFVGATGV